MELQMEDMKGKEVKKVMEVDGGETIIRQREDER